MDGRRGVRWDTFLIVNKRINSDLFERMALSFSARRIGIFTTQNGRLMVVHKCGGGGRNLDNGRRFQLSAKYQSC
jgi:hypothetical protein